MILSIISFMTMHFLSLTYVFLNCTFASKKNRGIWCFNSACSQLRLKEKMKKKKKKRLLSLFLSFNKVQICIYGSKTFRFQKQVVIDLVRLYLIMIGSVWWKVHFVRYRNDGSYNCPFPALVSCLLHFLSLSPPPHLW